MARPLIESVYTPCRPAFETLESRTLMSVAAGTVPWGRARLGLGVVEEPPAIELDLSPTPAAPTDVAVAAARSPLGGNLNFQGDRIQDLPFADLVKTTRGFYNLAGRVASNGKIALANTGTNGWPREDFAFSAIDNSEWKEPVFAGTYKVSFVGPTGATVAVRRNGPNAAGTVSSTAPLPTLKKIGYNATTRVHTYDVIVPQGVITLAFDVRNTGGTVTNVKVVQPGYSLTSTPTFTNEYLNLLRNLAPNVLRLMDWTHTNNNPVANWVDRTKPTDATQTKVALAGDLQPDKGIAWEYGISLANTLGAGVWVNVPHRATDDYVRQLATLLKNSLRSTSVIYVEHSNEVWNTVFSQTKYNTDQAKAEVARGGSNLNHDGSTNSTTWADRRHARRTKQISDIFRSVFGAAAINTRVRVVLGGQVSNLSRFDNELAYLNKFYGAPKNYLYSVGVAPYINLGGNQNKAGLTKDQVLNSLASSVNNYANNGVFTNARNKAAAYGLKLQAYEGGIDTFGDQSVAAKKAAVLDPRIKDIMKNYLNVWYSKGGDQFNWFTLGARSYNTPYGTWAITDNIRNFNQPKEAAFREVRDAGLGT